MSLSICVLGSGSSGNATYVASEQSAVLIDAGFSGREMVRRFEGANLDISKVNGICFSHEHQDHTCGAAVLNKRHQIPLYANSGTAEAISAKVKNRDLPWRIFSNGSPFMVGDLQIEPFSVPHDAYDPVGFIIRCGSYRIGVVTDVGIATTLLRERLKGCHALVIESNHDETLVQEAERPWFIKQRTLGRQGHLSNRATAELLSDVAGPELRKVFLVHLSGDCNREELAFNESRKALDENGLHEVEVTVSPAAESTPIWHCDPVCRPAG